MDRGSLGVIPRGYQQAIPLQIFCAFLYMMKERVVLQMGRLELAWPSERVAYFHHQHTRTQILGNERSSLQIQRLAFEP